MSKADRTRQYIIEKTGPIFNTKGYAGTSLTDLTEATGLTKGAIYGNFINKDEVALEAFSYNMEQITMAISKQIEARQTPWDKLIVFPEFYRKAFEQQIMAAGCPIVNTAPEADDTHAALCELVNKAIRRWDKAIAYLVQQGIEVGQIKKETDSSKISSLIIVLIEGGVLITKSTGNMKYLYAAVDQVVLILKDIKE